MAGLLRGRPGQRAGVAMTASGSGLDRRPSRPCAGTAHAPGPIGRGGDRRATPGPRARRRSTVSVDGVGGRRRAAAERAAGHFRSSPPGRSSAHAGGRRWHLPRSSRRSSASGPPEAILERHLAETEGEPGGRRAGSVAGRCRGRPPRHDRRHDRARRTRISGRRHWPGWTARCSVRPLAEVLHSPRRRPGWRSPNGSSSRGLQRRPDATPDERRARARSQPDRTAREARHGERPRRGGSQSGHHLRSAEEDRRRAARRRRG